MGEKIAETNLLKLQWAGLTTSPIVINLKSNTMKNTVQI